MARPKKLMNQNDVILAALKGFETQKQEIESRLAELRAMIDGRRRPRTAATSEEAPKRKRKLSAAGRAAISAAAKKRWAAIKAAKEAPAPMKVSRKNGAGRKAKKAAKPAVAAAE